MQYVINNTYHSSLKTTLSKLFLGYIDQRNHSDAKLVQFLDHLAKIELNTEDIRNDTRKIASEAIEKIKAYNKVYYDKIHLKNLRSIKGDYVMIRDSVSKPGESKKLKAS